MATALEVDRAYRRALEQLRSKMAAAAAAAFRESIDGDDIIGSYSTFVAASSDTIAAGQGAAQSLATAYLEQLGAQIADELDEIVGTTRAGKTLEDGLGPFGAMMLETIGNGASTPDAIAFGETLVSGFVDREVTAAADRETEHQVDEDPGAWRWEGIVQPDSCDACQENGGIHDADEDIYRHNNCACQQRWIPPGTTPTTQRAQAEQAAGELVAQATEAEPAVTTDIGAIAELLGLDPNATFVVNGRELHTLDARLKTEESTARKIAGALAVDPELTLEEATAAMRDNLRYTYVAEVESYDDSLRAATLELVERGYTPQRATNFWEREGYAGVNTNWVTPEGQQFELQFHTQASLETKEAISHPLYEQQRLLPEGSSEWDELQAAIDEAWGDLRESHEGLGDLPWLEEIFPEVR